VLDTWALVRGGTRQEYGASDPASATIRTSNVDIALIERIKGIDELRLVEARASASGSVYTSTGWRSAVVISAPDFAKVRIGVIKGEQGDWPVTDDAVAVESSSLDFSGTSVGERLQVRVGDREPIELPVTAVARDVGLAPGWMEHVVYLFVTPATMAKLNGSGSMEDIRIVVRDRTLGREKIRAIANQAAAIVRESGRVVRDIDVPVPGRHIHAAQIDSLLFTQGAFGVLALLLSGFLVVNLISAMLAGQAREIGVMKAIGASSRDIMTMYCAMAMVIGIGVSLVAVPIAYVIGKKYAAFTAELLNFDIGSALVPFWIIAVQVAVGTLLPVIASAIPVKKAASIKVVDAIRETGIASVEGREAPLLNVSGLARPLLLSIRNAFRKRARMLLTLSALAVGGAVYLGAINLQNAIRASVDTLFGSQRFDAVIRFVSPQSIDSLESIARGVDGVVTAEAWSGARAARKRSDGSVGNAFPITAPAAGSSMLSVAMVNGRWLKRGDSNALVINRRLAEEEPGMTVGATVTLVVKGRETDWMIVGITEATPSPAAYATRESITDGSASTIVVDSRLEGNASQLDLIQRLRSRFEESGFAVQSSQLMTEQRAVVEDHLLMVAGFLGFMGKLIIIVGGLGLASTLSMGVLERTREIGVMRAIGARNSWIASIIQVEGLVIAVASWLAAIPLSIPMSAILGRAFGRIMVPVHPHLLPGAGGVLSWLAVAIVVSVLACAWPAMRAIRIPTAQALAYE
jgi:putative ABC transport system permease protein